MVAGGVDADPKAEDASEDYEEQANDDEVAVHNGSGYARWAFDTSG